MKELSLEEKAKAYDEAIERAKGVIEQNPLMEHLKKGIEYIFPELRESEDERMRKELLKHLREVASGKSLELSTTDYERWANWVEKQGEQKPTDKVEPKFKVGDTVKDPYGDLYHITEIIDDSYKTDDGRFILFKNQEVYTLSNFTAWSEEDERILNGIIDFINSGNVYNVSKINMISWLKNLRPQSQWKPSDGQMEYLAKAIITLGDEGNCKTA